MHGKVVTHDREASLVACQMNLKQKPKANKTQS